MEEKEKFFYLTATRGGRTDATRDSKTDATRDGKTEEIRLMVRVEELVKHSEQADGSHVIIAESVTPVAQYSTSNWSYYIFIEQVKNKEYKISCLKGFDLELSSAPNFVGSPLKPKS